MRTSLPLIWNVNPALLEKKYMQGRRERKMGGEGMRRQRRRRGMEGRGARELISRTSKPKITAF